MPPLAALVLAVALALTPTPRAPAVDAVGVWPLQPQPPVVRPFDPPDSPYGPGHRGVDLLGAPGQQVHTALAGTVTYAGLLAGRGVVVVDHGSTRTTYQPVTATVPLGATLQRGAPIGTLDLPGSHCLPRACLHWGWIQGASTYLNPLLLVGLGPVRLLPLWRATPAALRVEPPTRPRQLAPVACHPRLGAPPDAHARRPHPRTTVRPSSSARRTPVPP